MQTLGAVGAAGLLAGCSSGGRNAVEDTPTPTRTDTGPGVVDGVSTDYFEAGPTVGLEVVATGLTSPTSLVTPGDGTDRRFVVDQTGTIHVHDENGLQSEPFLDLSGQLVALGQDLPNWIAFDERGLLGLAFHPDFADNGRFFVRYSAPTSDGALDHYERLSEFSVADDGTADPDSERILLELPWEREIHQAGTIEFGPDGFLYGALGDGLNPFNGQDTDTLKGCIFRIDVDNESGDRPYAVPSDNPLVGRDGRDELYAWGLRNPWKMAFSGDRLIVGDVGQATWEEVNVIERGANYGWPLKEGTRCHDPQLGTSAEGECIRQADNGDPLVDPVVEFPHFDSEGDAVGFAVIGGHVHTGPISEVEDSYLFGVFTASFVAPAGRILAATPQSSGTWPVRELQFEDGLDIQVLSLGQDGSDSYVLGTRAALADDPLTQSSGVVYRLTQ